MPMGGRVGFRLCFGSFCSLQSPREQEPVWNVLPSAPGAVRSLMEGGARRGGGRLLRVSPHTRPVMPRPHVGCASGGAGSSANLL